MADTPGKVVIIGAGIAGLCTAVYARRCGYQVEIVEQHDTAGGLATSWRRGDYTFETCLHWLIGSNPNGTMHAQWQEVFDIDKLTFVDPEEFVRLETEGGQSLSIYSNVDRLEAKLLRQAPQDAAEIRHLASAIRRFAKFPMPDPSEPWPRMALAMLRVLPDLPSLWKWSRLSIAEYGGRFSHPLLRSFFDSGETGKLSMLALVFSLAWMSGRNAGYAVGGSQAIIRLILAKLDQLGARLRFGTKVEKILVEYDAAVGVRLAGGEAIAADWVISAADGHATVYDMLGGKYADASIVKLYDGLQTFPSYVQVSLGVARDLSQQAGYVTCVLDTPFTLDPETQLRQVAFRFFHFDPTFAPPGKTAVTCFLPTRNFAFWADLQRKDQARYHAEKRRVETAVIAILKKMVPDIGKAIEVADVSTPATVIRYTNNWKGSMEGWLLTPGMGFKPLRNTLPGLRRFLMAGQWVMPGGGLPSGVMTARLAVRSLCKQDRIPFLREPRQASAVIRH
jgi:phytoene dehydrogenase-like protein